MISNLRTILDLWLIGGTWQISAYGRFFQPHTSVGPPYSSCALSIPASAHALTLIEPAGMATITVPLTTVFTNPPNCAEHWTFEPSATDGNDVPGGLLLHRAQGPPFVPLSALDQTCYPYLGDSWGRYPGTAILFSPGVCPYDYTTASQFNGPTTTGTCCPVGFDYTSTIGTLNGGTANVVFHGCTSLYDSNSGPTSVFAISPYGTSGTLDKTAALVTTISDPIIMWAQPITVAYQERDLSFLPMSTTTSTPSSVDSSLPTSLSDSTTISNPPAISRSSGSRALTPPSVHSSLSTSVSAPPVIDSPSALPHSSDGTISNGAIAGIAVGAAALVSIVVGCFLWFRRRKSRRGPVETPSTFTSPSSFGSDFQLYKGHAQMEPETCSLRQHELASNSGHHRGGTESPWLRDD